MAFALAFSNAASARRGAKTSQDFQWANATSGSLALYRAALFQAVVFSVDADLGVATQEAEALAHAEATRTLEALSQWIDAAPASEDELTRSLQWLHGLEVSVGEAARSPRETGSSQATWRLRMR